MNKIIEKNIEDKYFKLCLYSCNLDTILYASKLGNANVIIENYRTNRNNDWSLLKLQLNLDLQIEQFLCRNVSMDLNMSKDKFLLLENIWNKRGVYAIFLNSVIKFRACELDDFKRYNALKNFGWNLEIIVPDPSCGEWSEFTSPDKKVIELIKLKYEEK